MKTLVQRIKSTLQADATVIANVPSTSILVVSPDVLPDISQTSLPFIGIAPVATSEAWFSTGFLNETHLVRLFVVQSLEVYETSMIGDTVKPSIFELLTMVKNAVRAKYFKDSNQNDYLSKPSVISGVRYTTSPYGDNMFVFVGAIDLQCIRQISATVS